MKLWKYLKLDSDQETRVCDLGMQFAEVAALSFPYFLPLTQKTQRHLIKLQSSVSTELHHIDSSFEFFVLLPSKN